MKSIEDMMKAAQEAAATVQAQMEEAQAKLDAVEVEGVSGGGLIRIRASAKGRIKAIAIDDSLMVAAEKQMLEDLLAAAFNDARAKADRASNEEMGQDRKSVVAGTRVSVRVDPGGPRHINKKNKRIT